MTAEFLKEWVVPADDAGFWLDRWGHWCNRHGRFQHKKIIAHFHASIGRDENGYFVSQINGAVREKVYFRYEDTALFVFAIAENGEIQLVLNTGRRIPLDPTALFIRRDALYLRQQGDVIKFTESTMRKMAVHFAYEGSRCFLNLNERRWPIPMEDV